VLVPAVPAAPVAVMPAAAVVVTIKGTLRDVVVVADVVDVDVQFQHHHHKMSISCSSVHSIYWI